MKYRLLEEFYYGNISPNDKSVIRGSKYDKLGHIIVRHQDALNKSLNKKDKEILQKLVDALIEQLSLESMESFKEGFKLGLRFTAESFLDESRNFKDITD